MAGASIRAAGASTRAAGGVTAAVAVLLVLVAGCAASTERSGDAGDSRPGSAGRGGSVRTESSVPADGEGSALVGSRGERFPAAPDWPDGPIVEDAEAAVEELIVGLPEQRVDHDALRTIGRSSDPRLLWFVSDLLRFGTADDRRVMHEAFAEVTGVRIEVADWSGIKNHLIAWDIPAYPGYRADKARVYLLIEPAWAPFFEDGDSIIDWRLVGWGGVLIDDRLDGSPGNPCYRCIPALDDPPVTDAAGGDWYPDERLVFGVVLNGEARAYPKNIMEVHEMVNDSLGGRRIAIPYCTLCGSAHAYFTDTLDGFQPVLRTSGLLSRSNKFTYDISTWSAVDTFSGKALSGPLFDAGVTLEQASVVTSTWAAWKDAYPNTTIVAEDGGIQGRAYPLDPLRGRDDDGPIFPVGDVDQRLPVQERVLGVIAPDGTPVAFPVARAVLALRADETVTQRGVRVERSGSGVRATIDGENAASHEAFWFAWSQFYPDTEVWER